MALSGIDKTLEQESRGVKNFTAIENFSKYPRLANKFDFLKNLSQTERQIFDMLCVRIVAITLQKLRQKLGKKFCKP